ncbi:MAG: bile acid:sodium symporter family protein [Gemmatimonadaceae bacterium]
MLPTDASPTLVFEQRSLVTLNIIMACMMFGVSLSLRPSAFREVARSPRAALVGLGAQYVVVPALTCVVTWALHIEPSLALGMMLVAACPGGSFSNVLTWLARGNVALAVGMTAVSSLVAPVVMPANFALYGWLNPITRPVLQAIALPVTGILSLVLGVLVLPLLSGMAVGHRFPALAQRIDAPLRAITTLVFLSFVGIAFAQNWALFVARFQDFFWLVVGQNALALLTGQIAARLARLSATDRRAITIEVGIHNTGLGLIVLFTFFPQADGMILIAAFWGVWHLVSGLGLAQWWARRPIVEAPTAHQSVTAGT